LFYQDRLETNIRNVWKQDGFLQGYPPELAGDCAHATAWMLNNGTDMPLGSPACGNCKNVDCTSAPKCFEYGGYDFGNCTYKNDIPKAIKLGTKSGTSFHVWFEKRSFMKNDRFCPDRLGTNTRKTQKREPYSQASPTRTP